MPLACTLGLAACLSFGGSSYPAKDAVQILDNCELVAQLPAGRFAGATGMGVAVGESIEKLGLKLQWAQSGQQRKALWTATCNRFNQAFNTKSLWSHLEKWPY